MPAATPAVRAVSLESFKSGRGALLPFVCSARRRRGLCTSGDPFHGVTGPLAHRFAPCAHTTPMSQLASFAKNPGLCDRALVKPCAEKGFCLSLRSHNRWAAVCLNT